MPGDLLTEFFYDGIMRVIPGLIVIGFCRVQFFMEDYFNFRDASIAGSFWIFLAAWLIGTIVDYLTYKPLLQLLGLVKKWCKMPKSIRNFIESLPKETILEVARFEKALQTAGLVTRRQYYKLLAEKIMFRCLWVIFFFISIFYLLMLCGRSILSILLVFVKIHPLNLTENILSEFWCVLGSFALCVVCFRIYFIAYDTCEHLKKVVLELEQMNEAERA
jgi:hypothetical protein